MLLALTASWLAVAAGSAAWTIADLLHGGDGGFGWALFLLAGVLLLVPAAGLAFLSFGGRQGPVWPAVVTLCCVPLAAVLWVVMFGLGFAAP